MSSNAYPSRPDLPESRGPRSRYTLSKALRVCVVTGSRSEYGLLRWLMQDLAEDARFELSVVVTGSHLSEAYGSTYREIEQDGFRIDAKVEANLDARSGAALAKAVGAWTQGFADVFEKLGPDLLIIMGDRYELLSVASACILQSIPIAHISGGEITEGAIDEQIRHALTKISHLHFVANPIYAQRVRQMGEEPWRICVAGEPGLENIWRLPLLPQEELGKALGLDLTRRTALVTFHPVTRDLEKSRWHMKELLSALEQAGMQYVMTYPNADLGSGEIVEALQAFVSGHPETARLVQNLGQKRYLSLLKTVHLMIGNSSSGLVEAPSFNLPAVNIGDRQKGRLRASNVIDVEGEAKTILQGIQTALLYDRTMPCQNPYGDGHSSPCIRSFIERAFSRFARDRILKKQFVDLPAATLTKDYLGGSFELHPRETLSPSRIAWENYFQLGPHHVLLASGRSAFRHILEEIELGESVILIPDYLCGEVLVPVLKQLSIPYRYYRIQTDLTISLSVLREQVRDDVGAILLINYFGLCDWRGVAQSIRSWNDRIAIIQDDVQALYEPHFLSAGDHWADYVFVSFRKFLSVPDGAFVRAKRPIRNVTIDPPVSNQGLSHLVASLLKASFLSDGNSDSFECGLEKGYLDLYENASREIPSSIAGMTSFTRDFLRWLPLESWAQRRIQNFHYVASMLVGMQGVGCIRSNIVPGQVPFTFPILVEPGLRERLRAFLRARNIFCPVHWPVIPELDQPNCNSGLELSRGILSLPIDQRYDPVQLERMVHAIQEFWRTLS